MNDTPCSAGANPRLVGDPVDTLTGAVVDGMLDFRLTGPIELRWTRYYDSSQCNRSFSVGRACAHEFDRSLTIEADGLFYEESVRRVLKFPLLVNDGDECAFHGFTVQRVSADHYFMFTHAEPAMEFVFRSGERRVRLTRLVRGNDQVRFHYDAKHKLIGIDDSAGRRLTAEEDDQARLVRLAVNPTAINPGYLLIAYEYDNCGNLIRTANSEGHGYTFVYDDANRMVLRQGRKGFRFYFKYDAEGRCIRSMGDDRLYGVALKYTVPGRVTKVTRPDRGVWTYIFTLQGKLQEIVDPLGGIQKFIFDPATGRQVQEIDPNGNLSSFVYDVAGAAIARIDPLGHRVPLPEDINAPDPLSHRVAANAAEYEYGRLLNVDGIALPSLGQIQELNLSREVQPFICIRSPAAETTGAQNKFKVPPLRVLWWPPPNRGRIFNDLGKLIEQRDDLGRQRTWAYDESGNVAGHVDFDGGQWVYDYGSWHFLRGLTDPTGTKVRFMYTPYGEVASFTDGGGTKSEYGYDQKDQLVEVRRHGVVKETYTRDACGNLIAKHTGDGRVLLRFEIGYGNLPVKRILASGDEHTFEYDFSGRYLVGATKKDRVEFAYDDLGNRTVEKRNGVGVEHRFQGWRRLAESVFLGRFTVRYEWQGNTLTVTDPGGHRHELRFLGHGLIERRFSNGSRELAQYDGMGRCLFKHAQRQAGQIWTRRYHWSGEGELRRVEDNIGGEARHEYDAAHRLRRRIINGRVETYDMDAADNLLAQPGLDSVQLLDGNRLKASNGETFTYNDRNHIKSRHGIERTTRYVYDSRDQLVRVESPEGVWEADYDALGRRTRKIWGGETTEYYWNTDQLVVEVHSDGRMRLYIYPDPLALTPLLFLDYESIEAPAESCQLYFIFTDQIGAPCLVEDEKGVAVWHARIEPFGHVDIDPGTKIHFNFRFPGHYLDAELALHYNRFRYYDPALGRYLQSDPWGITGGYNLYAYRTNPLGTVDVRGLGEDGDPHCRPPGEDGPSEESPRRPPHSDTALNDMTPEQMQDVCGFHADRLAELQEPRPERRTMNTFSVGVLEDEGGGRRLAATSNMDVDSPPNRAARAYMEEHGIANERDATPRLTREPVTDENGQPIRDQNGRVQRQTVDADTGEPYNKRTRSEHHAEQRMETVAAQNNETVAAQSPSQPCCPGCQSALSQPDANGVRPIDRIPPGRQGG